MCRKLICKLGVHAVSDWQYQSPQTCTQLQVCDRCGRELGRQVAHSWGPWAPQPSAPCTRVRLCQRCGTEQREPFHDWGQPQYEKPRDPAEIDSTQMVRICRKCGEREEQAVCQICLSNQDLGSCDRCYRTICWDHLTATTIMLQDGPGSGYLCRECL